MCGRFALKEIPKPLLEELDLTEAPPFGPRYNIAPSQVAPAAFYAAGEKAHKIELLKWGLIPSWAADASIANRLINARIETADGRPAFREAFRLRRCLVPADGFFEWQKTGKTRVPYFVRPAKDAFFALAGIWEKWKSPDGREIKTFTILTAESDAAMSGVHERMPVIIARPLWRTWLDPRIWKSDELKDVLKTRMRDEIRIVRIGALVNDPKNDGPGCIMEIGE